MEDLIACLYPFEEGDQGYATRAVELPENSSRKLDAEGGLPDLPGRNSRESTAPLDENEATNTNRGGRLQLTFTHGPKAGPGFFLGTDPNTCDILLPSLPGISRRHCYLTFDSKRRLMVRDCSKYGTIVEYNGKGGEKRRHFTWIIGGHDIPDNTKKIVVQLHENLKLQVVVSKPSYPHLYLANVEKLLQATETSQSLPLGALGIQSSDSTADPSGAHTPKQDPILLEQELLGEGGFGKVFRVWDVSTGIEYASKMIIKVEQSNWRKEAAIMRQISHEHMVRLFFVIESPPQLILEYLPLGNLRQAHLLQSLSKDEVRRTLEQGLSALTYLHGQTPPIVHRDIKPENLLVLTRDPLHIKLGDFGLSKASEDLQTVCGTMMYYAPEIIRIEESESPLYLTYTRAVDIWALGVVILQYSCGLPYPGTGRGLSWCRKLVERLNDQKPDDLVDILLNMLVMDAQGRHSAEECLEKALQLERPSRSSTPREGSNSSFQAGPGSPAEEISIDKLCGIQDSRFKRRRSPATNSDENRRTMKPFSRVHSLLSVSVLRLLTVIQRERDRDGDGDGDGDGDRDGDGDDYGFLDTRTSASIHILREQLERLKITELKKHPDSTAQRIILTGVFPAGQFTVATFNSSNCENSVAGLAERITDILELLSLDATNSPIVRENLPSSQENRATPGTQRIETTEESVDDSNDPFTNPSALLDERNVSG